MCTHRHHVSVVTCVQELDRWSRPRTRGLKLTRQRDWVWNISHKLHGTGGTGICHPIDRPSRPPTPWPDRQSGLAVPDRVASGFVHTDITLNERFQGSWAGGVRLEPSPKSPGCFLFEELLGLGLCTAIVLDMLKRPRRKIYKLPYRSTTSFYWTWSYQNPISGGKNKSYWVFGLVGLGLKQTKGPRTPFQGLFAWCLAGTEDDPLPESLVVLDQCFVPVRL